MRPLPRTWALFLLFGPGCAVLRARMPDYFYEQSQEVEIDHPWFGFSGTTIHGLTLDGGFIGVTSSDETADASDSLEIERDGEVLWAVECASIADIETRPSVYLTCLFRPNGKQARSLSLALTSSVKQPLSGIYVSPLGPLGVRGTMETEAGLRAVLNTGYSILRLPSQEVVAFVDQGQPEGRIAAFARLDITDEEREAIAPLLVTLAQMRDARMGWRDRSSSSIS